MRRYLVATLLISMSGALGVVSGCASAPVENSQNAAAGNTSVAVGTTLQVQPPAAPVRVGDSTTVNVRIVNAANLWGLSLNLAFDPALLDCVREQPGTIPKPDIVARQVCAASAAQYIVSQQAPGEPARGDGVVVQVELKCKQAGTSPLRLENVKLVDRDGLSQPNTLAAGQLVCAGR